MASELYFLSIFERFAQLICAGRKKWEFRENPAFGHDGDHTLGAGDTILIIASCDEPYIICKTRVEEILRGEELSARFDEIAASSGVEADTPMSEFFRSEILGKYKTALRLTPTPLPEPVSVERIVRETTGRSWSGRGFCHVSSLKRFCIDGRDLDDFFA